MIEQGHLVVLVIIMISAGFFGGVINYVINSATSKNITSCGGFWKDVIVGIGASFLIPVFLDMASSDIMITSQKEQQKLLIFFGFCLLAGIYSKNFIATVSEKFLKNEFDKMDKKVDKIAVMQKKEKFIGDAKFYMENKNYPMALASLDGMINEFPEDTFPYIGKGRVYKLQNKFDLAIEMTNKVIEKKGFYEANGYYNRACYKNLSGTFNINDIISDLKQAILLNNDYLMHAKEDNDFESIKNDPQFINLIHSVQV